MSTPKSKERKFRRSRFKEWRTRVIWKAIHRLELRRVRKAMQRGESEKLQGLWDFPKWSLIGLLSRFV